MNPEIAQSLYCGATRYGKTERAFGDVLQRLENIPRLWRPSLVWIDPPGGSSKKLLMHARRLRMPVLYEPLWRAGRTLGYSFGKASSHPDPAIRKKETHLRLEEWKAWILKGEHKLDDSLNPVIKEGLNNAGGLLLHQKVAKPLCRLWRACNIGSEDFWWFVSGCTQEDTVRDWMHYYSLYENGNFRELEFLLGPARRRLKDLAEMPVIQERDGESFDFDAMLARGSIYLFDGESQGRVSRDESRRMADYIILRTIQFSRNIGSRHVILVVDEGQSGGNLDAQVSRSLRECAKWKLEQWWIIQSVLALPEEVREDLVNCCARMLFFRQFSPEAVRYVARILAVHHLDLHELHSVEVRKRQRHVGSTTERRGAWETWEDDKGKKGKRFRDSEIAVPQYEDIEEEHKKYVDLEDQIKLKEQKVVEAGVGDFMQVNGNYVSTDLEYKPMRETKWEFSKRQFDYHFNLTLASVMAQAMYRLPLERKPPKPEPKSPPPTQTNTTEKKTEKSGKPAKKGVASRLRDGEI